jgi:hypothetical protein
MQARLRDVLRRHPRAVGAWVAGSAVVLLAVAVGLANEADSAPLTLDRFGSGNFMTEAGWFSFWLTPRSPDGYPGC